VGLLSWILFGLLAGAVARMITPGRQVAGCLPTLIVGIIGAVIGGLAGQAIFGHEIRFRWDVGPFLLAVLGAVALLLLLEAIGRGGRR